MTIIYALLGISIAVALVFFILFVLSVKRGQYDDTFTPAIRMLFDDEKKKEQNGLKEVKPNSNQ